MRGTRSATRLDARRLGREPEDAQPADSIVVFVDGKSVFFGETGNIPRKDILERYGVDKAGFIFRLPGGLLPAAGAEHQVRVFALAGEAAAELRYLPGYPWATKG